MSNFAIDGENITTFYNNVTKELKTVANNDTVKIQMDLSGTGPDWEVNTILIIKYSYTNSLGVIQTASFRGRISTVFASSNPLQAYILV